MLSSSAPEKIAVPFANTGAKRAIPIPSQISITPGAASYTDGFPPKTMTPISDGGIPPDGLDMNGALFDITSILQWQSAGGVFKYDAVYSGLVGGYPKGAILANADDTDQWVSTVDNNMTDPDGVSPAGWVSMAARNRGFATSKDFKIKSDGSTDDLNAIRNAVNTTAALGMPLYILGGVSEVSDWIPLPTNLKMVFMPGAQWKLTGVTAVGGFVCGGMNLAMAQVPFEDVDIWGINLDCNQIPGENALTGTNGINVKIHAPQVYRTMHDAIPQPGAPNGKLGGRVTQFEGAAVNGVTIYDLYCKYCSIGINSQGSPTGSEVVSNVRYFNVVMEEVDNPVNTDSQFPNPETNTPSTMSTYIDGMMLYNCGKITWPGNAGGDTGGIFTGDRGFGVHATNVQIYNEPSYGAIGGLWRGVGFGIRLSNVRCVCPSMIAPFDFSVRGYGGASVGTFPSTVFTDNVEIVSTFTNVVKAGPSTGRIGPACLRGVSINGALSGMTGIFDANASGVTTAQLELILSDQGGKTSQLRSFKNIFDNGNLSPVCQNLFEQGTLTPIDASVAGLVFTSSYGDYEKHGQRVDIAFRVAYPVNANGSNAQIDFVKYLQRNNAGRVCSGFALRLTDQGAPITLAGNPGTSVFTIFPVGSLTPLTNAQMSGKLVDGILTYYVDP